MMTGMSSIERKHAEEELEQQQQQPLQQRMVQPVLFLLSIGAFVLLLTLGPSIMQQGTTTTATALHQEEVGALVLDEGTVQVATTTTTATIGTRKRNNIRRVLSTLTPPDVDHANFFEYLPGTYDFILRRREGDGELQALVEVNPENVQSGQSDTYIVDCPVVSQYRADCYDTIDQFNFTLDIFTFEATDSAVLPNVLYTRPDGNIYSIYDPTTHWIHDSTIFAPSTDDSSTKSCSDKVLRFFGYNANTDSAGQRTLAMCIATITLLAIFASTITLLIVMVSTIRMIHRRSQYRKQLMNEIHLEGTIRYAPSTALPTMSPASASKMISCSSSSIKKNVNTNPNKNHTNNNGAGADDDSDDHTEMMEFSDDSDDVDPTELREVDLSR
jgi:hypothetical protein